MLHWSHVLRLALPRWDGCFIFPLRTLRPSSGASFCLLHLTPVESLGTAGIYLNCWFPVLMLVHFRRIAPFTSKWCSGNVIDILRGKKKKKCLKPGLSGFTTVFNKNTSCSVVQCLNKQKFVMDNQVVTELCESSRCVSCSKHQRCKSNTTHKHLWNYLWHKRDFWRITSTIIYRWQL